MIVQGKSDMIPELKKIWMDCFGDSEEYVDFFMERRFPTAESLVWLEDGEPVGALYLLPCYLGEGPAWYTYAIGVLPRFRCRGICACLLRAVGLRAERDGFQVLLQPRQGLSGYYHRRGFTDAFWYKTIHVDPGHFAPCPVSIRPAGPVEYARLRDAFFQSHGYIRWDIPAVSYALEESRFCGGCADILSWQGGKYLLFGGVREDATLFLRETTLPTTLPAGLAAALCEYYHASRLEWRCPSPKSGAAAPAGCLLGGELETAGWLGLDLS